MRAETPASPGAMQARLRAASFLDGKDRGGA